MGDCGLERVKSGVKETEARVRVQLRALHQWRSGGRLGDEEGRRADERQRNRNCQ